MRALSTKTKAVLAVGLVTVLGGTTAAIQQAVTTGAEEPHPIIEQVGEHEVRIDSLEGRADETETKVEQNAADVQVIQEQTGIAPAPAVSPATRTAPTASTETTTVAAPVSEPVAPTPTPEPPKNPRLITGVSDLPSTPGMHACDYTLYDPKQNVTLFIQPVGEGCLAVGEVLPYL